MEDKRYSMKELTALYDVDRKTILQWVRELGFPLFSVSPKKRYARESELRQWENAQHGRCVEGDRDRT
jgi:hypothetical protein